MIAIAKEEGLIVEQNAAEILVEQVGNDIRQVLHAMQVRVRVKVRVRVRVRFSIRVKVRVLL
jgi:hypothetical protein